MLNRLGARKRTLKTVRADDSDDDNDLNVVQGRTVNLSKDRRRVVSSATTSCARGDGPSDEPLAWTNRFHLPDTVPIIRKARRYANSVFPSARSFLPPELIGHAGPEYASLGG